MFKTIYLIHFEKKTMAGLMGGKTIQDFFRQEAKSMLDSYRNFETLVPAENGEGAGHRGEDGRFVETLLRRYLSNYLPKELEVSTGFILRPAVKTGKDDKVRKGDQDLHSTQLDIIVYNSAHYPVFLRSNDTILVPPEGVIAIISVKKNLHDSDIKKELMALKDVSQMCRVKGLRPPFLALVSMDSKIEKKETFDWIFNQMEEAYAAKENLAFDDLVGYVGALCKWSIFKRRPSSKNPNDGEYIVFNHPDEGDFHLGLQFLLTGILSVFYDPSRTNVKRPGFTAFPSDTKPDKCLGKIETQLPAQVFKGNGDK